MDLTPRDKLAAKEAQKLQFVKVLPYEIRCKIYEEYLQSLIHLASFYPVHDDRYKNIVRRSLSERGFCTTSIFDLKSLASERKSPIRTIKDWFWLAHTAFCRRGNLYDCHQRFNFYERAVRDLTLQCGVGTAEDFKTYYWDTRVVDVGGCWGKFSYGFRYYYKGESSPYPIRRSQVGSSPDMIDHQDDGFLCEERTRHIALHFDTTREKSRFPNCCKRNVTIPGPPTDKFARPTSIVPTDQFAEVCNHIITNVPNLKSLYLWIALSRYDAEEILLAPADQPTALVKLIRRIPVIEEGRFTVKVLINPFTRDILSAEQLKQLRTKKGWKTYLVRDWNGPDGPERYANLCREFEEKFEVLMRPESLATVQKTLTVVEQLEEATKKLCLEDEGKL